jgi:hypothetical protein
MSEMATRKLSVKGVLIGGIVDTLTSSLAGIALVVYAVSRLDVSHIPKSQLGAAVTAYIHANGLLYGVELLIGSLASVFGGYVGAWLAKHDELLNGACSAYLCVAIGIYSVVSGKGSQPLFVQILLFVASPVLGLSGGYLRLLRKSRTVLQP